MPGADKAAVPEWKIVQAMSGIPPEVTKKHQHLYFQRFIPVQINYIAKGQ